MTRHNEISTTYFPELIADNTLFALEITGRLYFRKRGFPVSVAERERSITAIMMLFISFEGMFNRIIYFLSNSDDPGVSGKYFGLKDIGPTANRLEGLLDNTAASRILVRRFKESLVLRNAIAHGHLYETSRNTHRKISKTNKLVLDDKNPSYINFVNPNTLRTRNLRLHVVPSEIGISDLYQILKLWNKIYLRLNKVHGTIARLQSYTFPDFSTHLKLSGFEERFNDLEERLIGRDDASFSELINLFDESRKQVSS